MAFNVTHRRFDRCPGPLYAKALVTLTTGPDFSERALRDASHPVIL
jgi:hypothetical protein